jgi:hypothetical protein
MVDPVSVERFMTAVISDDTTKEDSCAVLANTVLTMSVDAFALEMNPLVPKILDADKDEIDAELTNRVDPINVDTPS